MATQPIDTTLPAREPKHFYHAKAYVLNAQIEQPLRSEISPQALVELPQDGAYRFEEAGPFQLFGVLSYRSGYTQVAGHPSTKRRGFTTLTTSVVEGLNVLDVVTADRVVGQISTERPYDGEVPSVTFLGTRFVNLRIGGHPVDVHQDIHILGPKPDDDVSYLDDPDALARMSSQYTRIRETPDLPDWVAEQFRWDKAATQGSSASCSLVNNITGAPGMSFGHVIDLPHFGKIFLGEVSIDRQKAETGSYDIDTYHFKLTMIRLEMGCIGTGNATAVALDTNGGGSSGGPHK
jgi:hypothetical protein